MAATDHDEDTIYASAGLCSNLLDHILERAKNESESLLLIEELRGRFNLWARYVGVFAAQRASLDARLDPHPDIKDMVIELLDMVRRNLQWESESIPETSTDDASTTGSQSDETDIPDIARPGLSAAAAAVDRLIVLGTSIRRSGRQSHRSQGFTVSGGQEESLCCLLVRRKFPHAQKSLCDQVGASIHIRGTSLQYLKKHNDKLAYQRDAFGEPAATIIGGEAGELQDQETNVFHDQKHRSQQAPTTVETLPSRVSASKVSRSKKPTASIISRGSTVQEVQETAFYYPPEPEPSLGEKYISCTICSEPLEIEELTEKSWRAHVDHDLEPYVCLSEECKEPLRFFARKREWAQHMQTRHTMTWTQKVHTEKWYCDISHSDALEFDQKEHFLTHLKAEHGETLSKSQLQGRARRNRRVANRDPFICPLCDCLPENVMPLLEENPQKQLSEHIAQHLKSLAFLSLSYVQENLDDMQSVTEGSRDIVSSKAQNSRDSRQQHPDLRSLDDIPKTVIDPDGRRRVDGREVFFDDDGLPQLREPVDWSFLPAKKLPTDWALLKEGLTKKDDSLRMVDTFRRTICVIGDDQSKYPLWASLDTQAAVSIISKRWCEKIGKIGQMDNCAAEFILLFSKLTLTSEGKVTLDWHFWDGKQTYSTDFYVVDTDVYDVILGKDTIERYGLIRLSPDLLFGLRRSPV